MATRPRKSRLYTRTGDTGKTSLFGGRRVSKDDPRVAAYGTLDELNSAIGLAVSHLTNKQLIKELQSIQNELFDIGAELASDRPVRRQAKSTQAFQLGKAKVERLEGLIDAYDSKVLPLTTFILPSGPPGPAALHFARTVARRAERAAVTLARKEPVNPEVLAYLNRLCDLLFVMARYANKASRGIELTWRKNA